MINSGWFLILSSTIVCNNNKIGRTSYKVFALALKFASLHQEKIEKIFPNQYWPWNSYKLWYLKTRVNIFQDLVPVKNNTLLIWLQTRFFQDDENNKALWSKLFVNSITVMVALFGFTISPLSMLVLADIYHKISDFIKVQKWQLKCKLYCSNFIHILSRVTLPTFLSGRFGPNGRFVSSTLWQSQVFLPSNLLAMTTETSSSRNYLYCKSEMQKSLEFFASHSIKDCVYVLAAWNATNVTRAEKKNTEGSYLKNALRLQK